MAKAKELWGYREAARHFAISHRLAKKWAEIGLLPLIDEPVQGTVRRKGTRRVLDKWGIYRQEPAEEDVPCLKVFDAAVLKKLKIAELQLAWHAHESEQRMKKLQEALNG